MFKELIEKYGKRSIETLEKDDWGMPEDGEYSLVKKCMLLRKKRICEFDIENLRLMIGQNIGVKYLLPQAVQELSFNILAEGDLYEGDLLRQILNIDFNYWREYPDLYFIMKSAILDNTTLIKSIDIDCQPFLELGIKEKRTPRKGRNRRL